MITVRIENLSRWETRLAAGDPIVREELARAMESATLRYERGQKEHIQQDTRTAFRSIVSEVHTTETRVRGVVGILRGPAVQYGRVLNEGRTAGKPPPPVAPIAAWLRRKGGDPALAYVVARAIGKRGTKGSHFIEKSISESHAKAVQLFREASRRIVARLRGEA